MMWLVIMLIVAHISLMGYPANNVCNEAAGSALMKDERLVGKILDAVVVNAVNIPVMLKLGTAWDRFYRNAGAIAKIAESSGIQTITVHGRTRACQDKGDAEYDTIKTVKRYVNTPVIANGDIDSPEKPNLCWIILGRTAKWWGERPKTNPGYFNQSLTFSNTDTISPKPALPVCLQH